MNNKRGGFGAKLVLVLILMLASAAGGAYAFRMFDGSMAVREARKAIEDVDISDYDKAEQTAIQEYIDQATKDLDKAQTRKEVYAILTEFISDVDKIKTTKEKELEEALKAAEEARKENEELRSRQNGSDSDTYNEEDSGTPADSSSENGGNSGNSGSYKSNNLSGGETEDSDSGNGFLGSLLGGLAGGSSAE